MRFVLPLAKALYIGPRGGRWADAAHTIPYDADKDQDRPPEKERDQHEVRKIVFHPPKAMFGHDRGPQTVYVRRLEDGKARISQNPEAEFGPVMALESVKHFLNDLSGVVQGTKAKDPRVNAVLDGKAKLLGKGDDGIAYKVGDDVVKVSTTVPYQPMNPGHRTPQQAKDMLRKQHEITEEMISKGVQGLQHSEFVDNGDKGFQIKEWVEIPEKWTPDQLSQVQDILIDMHKKGYALNDAIQPGITKAGKVVMMDVGKASRIDPNDPKERGFYGRITNDMDALKYFYRESGVPFARKDIDEGAQAWEKVQELLEKDVPVGFIRLHARIATDKRKEVARGTLQGKELEDALEDIDFELEDLEYDLKVHEKKFGKSLALVIPLSKSLYIGPRGGKWADPEHTIPYDEKKHGRQLGMLDRMKPKAKPQAIGADSYAGPIKPGMGLSVAEDAIRKEPVEHLLAIGPKGEHLAVAKGEKDRVKLTTEMVAGLKALGGGQSSAVITHNHPSGNSLSTDDINLAFSLNLAEIRATCPDGGHWTLKRPDGDKVWTATTPPEMVRARLRRVQETAARKAGITMDNILIQAGTYPGNMAHPAFSQEKFNGLFSEEFRKAFAEEFSPEQWQIKRVGGPAKEDAGGGGGAGQGLAPAVPAGKEKALVEAAHDAVKAEIPLAARRAAAVGADVESLEYVGAGAEGIILEDGSGRVYKIARRHKEGEPSAERLRNEAEALESLSKNMPRVAHLIPKFHGYSAEHDVLIRDKVEGRAGGWGTKGIRDAYDAIAKALRYQEWTAPEFKEDSFIVQEGGGLVMVDLGFVQPLGFRGAERMIAKVEAATAGEDLDLLDIGFEMRQLYSEDGALTPKEALRMTRKIIRLKGYGPEVENHTKSLLSAMVDADDLKGGPALAKTLDYLQGFRAEPSLGKSLALVMPLERLNKAEQLGLFGTKPKPKKAPKKAPKKRKASRKGKAPAKASKPRKSTVSASGGPYYGPRGGKWADPGHKIPWKDRNKIRTRLKWVGKDGRELEGLNGNKVVGYHWISHMEEVWSEYEGGLVGKRVSNWEEAETCADCGRKIVHAFLVEEKETGKTLAYGGDHLHVALGYPRELGKAQVKRIRNKVQNVRELQRKRDSLVKKYETWVTRRAVPLSGFDGSTILNGLSDAMLRTMKLYGPPQVPAVFLVNEKRGLAMRAGGLALERFMGVQPGWKVVTPQELRAKADAAKPVQWQVQSITDTRDYDWETGKPIPGTGAASTCDRCGSTHDVIHTMRHPDTGELRQVGSTCGPKMAEGADTVSARSLTEAKKRAAKVAKQRQSAKIQEFAAQLANKLQGVALPAVKAGMEVKQVRAKWYESAQPQAQRTIETVDGLASVNVDALAGKSMEEKLASAKPHLREKWLRARAAQIAEAMGIPEKWAPVAPGKIAATPRSTAAGLAAGEAAKTATDSWPETWEAVQGKGGEKKPQQAPKKKTRKERDLDMAEDLTVEGYVQAGSEMAYEMLGPHAFTNPKCARCGSPIQHVFVTSEGPMGGDCLSTLTGDPEFRSAVRKVTNKFSKELIWAREDKLVGLKLQIQPSFKNPSTYSVFLLAEDPESGRSRSKFLGTASAEMGTTIAGVLEQHAEGEGLPFEFTPMSKQAQEKALESIRERRKEYQAKVRARENAKKGILTPERQRQKDLDDKAFQARRVAYQVPDAELPTSGDPGAWAHAKVRELLAAQGLTRDAGLTAKELDRAVALMRNAKLYERAKRNITKNKG